MANEIVPMSVRRLIIEIDVREVNVAKFCRMHGVSTWFFWDLRRRYQVEGDVVLEPKSRAPKTVANRTPAAMEDEIVAERKRLAEAGLDNGSASIGFYLRGRLDGVPSEAAIWRILHRRGFIVADPSKTPKCALGSFAAARANECWQVDDTGWSLADGTPVKIINILDDCTRTAIASRAVMSCTVETAFAAFTVGAQTWGWPERFLSDNAKAFRYGLSDALAVVGVSAGHSRPYHPQTCGKVERFHQTLKLYLAACDPAATVVELQTQLDAFSELYNSHRPHRSLDRRFPADVWHATPKSGPASTPLGTPTRISRRIVRNGTARAGNRYAISIGAVHNTKIATTIITGDRCHVFVDGRVARTLTLDTTRYAQTLYNRPGRPYPPTERDDPRHA